jgi:hypothetical protein
MLRPPECLLWCFLTSVAIGASSRLKYDGKDSLGYNSIPLIPLLEKSNIELGLPSENKPLCKVTGMNNTQEQVENGLVILGKSPTM